MHITVFFHVTFNDKIHGFFNSEKLWENEKVQDCEVNAQGKNLINLCISTRLRFLNGSYIGDSMGYFTCMTSNGFSSVDYAIVSESLLTSVNYFTTHSFNYLSDHVQLESIMNCNIR